MKPSYSQTSLCFVLALVLCACQPSAPRPTPPKTAAAPDSPGDATQPGTTPPIPDPPPLEPLGQPVGTVTRDGAHFRLEHGGRTAVVNAVTAQLLDFAPTGERDDLMWLSPSVFDGLKALPLSVRSAQARQGALHIEMGVGGRPLTLDVWFYFEGTTLVVDSALRAHKNVVAVSLGERIAWGNVPAWVEGAGPIEAPGTFTGAFLARQNHGRAYGLCSPDEPITARFAPFWLDGFSLWPHTSGRPVSVDMGSWTRRRVVIGTADTVGGALADLPCVAARKVTIPEPAPVGVSTEVQSCAGRPFVTSAAPVLAPLACARLRFVRPGHAPGPWQQLGAADQPTAQWPTAGTLKVTIRTKAGMIPGRVLVRGANGTPDPDWGLDSRGATRNVHYSESGRLQVSIPPGDYEVTVDRGFEYTRHRAPITVAEGGTAQFDAALVRQIDTSGWIAADLHLHAFGSMDAPVTLQDRVRSLAAVGVEVAVATDHNVVTDYEPAVRALGLEAEMASFIGTEITTERPAFGHFNAFPLKPDAAPIPFAGRKPAQLFEDARHAAPDGLESFVQVNHPRMREIGHFELMRFDPRAPKAWLRGSPLADLSFDGLEIYNGLHAAEQDQVERNLRDWYALLNAGFRHTATGNSDSHRLTYQEAGLPRTYVATAQDAPGLLNRAEFLESLRAGRAVVVGGPFIDFTVATAGPGQLAPAGPVEAILRVRAVPWVDVDRVELIKNGEVLKRWPVAPSQMTQRFAWKGSLDLAAGDWLVAIARGSRPMDHFHLQGVLPLSFTNPIRVAREPSPSR